MPMKKFALILIFIVVAGLGLPQNLKIPVQGADKSSYNAKSFWYYPWGKSGTHKGVDIFAKAGTEVISSSAGLVVYTGKIKLGGNVVLVLGQKWRLHYYAHLKEIKTSTLNWVSQGNQIGTVGTSGNAAGKPPHLHYLITSLLPLPWRIDSSVQGWKKMFYLNPIEYF
jgi:murein DD-endopeptidase MepM/ murein hydrolase activator NlpD